MKPFPKTKVDSVRTAIPSKQQPFQNSKPNTITTKYKQQQEEEIADESQVYEQLGQSLVGERQFIPFSEQNSSSPIEQNISITGTIEKVYFQNASRVNKQQLIKDTKIQNQIYAFQKSGKIKRQPEVNSIKTNPSNIKVTESMKSSKLNDKIKQTNTKDTNTNLKPKNTPVSVNNKDNTIVRNQNKPKSAVPITGSSSRKNIQQQEEEQNQFLSLNNVGKWNKSSNNDNRSSNNDNKIKQPVVSEEMKKLHTHYQNRLTETKWVKRKRQLQSRQSQQRTIVSQNAPSLSGVSSKDQQGIQDKNKSKLLGKNDHQLQEQINKSNNKVEKQQHKNQSILNQQQEQVQQEEQQQQVEEQQEVDEQEDDKQQQKQQESEQEQELEEQQQQSEKQQEQQEEEDQQYEQQEDEQQQDQQQSENEQEQQQKEEEQQNDQQQHQMQASQSPSSQNTWKTEQSPNSTIQSKNTNVKKWSQSKQKQQSSSSHCQNNSKSQPQNNSKSQYQNNSNTQKVGYTNKEQIEDLTQGQVQNDSIDPNWEPLEQILLRILKLVN